MKRMVLPLFIAVLTTIVFADNNRTMVIVKKDGNVHAIHTADVDSISFNQNDLSEKYYIAGNDTIILHDTITQKKEIIDTIFTVVYDTVYTNKGGV